MKSLFESIKTIYFQDRRVILWVMGLFLLGGLIVLMTVMNLAPGVADGMIVRYSDGGGYEKGGWGYMLCFAIMGVVLAVLHPFLAVRVYEKRGGSITVMFIVASMVLALVVLLTLMRLVGES